MAVEINPEDAKKLADFCRQTLGEPADWKGQVGYPDSLALCVIDSIWSLAANYDSHVVRVLGRYRKLRRESGADPNKDSAGDLTGWRYLLLLAGKQEVKPDRMVRRFVADAIGRAVNADEAHALLSAAAELLGVQPRELDHQVCRYQNGRTRPEEPDQAE